MRREGGKICKPQGEKPQATRFSRSRYARARCIFLISTSPQYHLRALVCQERLKKCCNICTMQIELSISMTLFGRISSSCEKIVSKLGSQGSPVRMGIYDRPEPCACRSKPRGSERHGIYFGPPLILSPTQTRLHTLSFQQNDMQCQRFWPLGLAPDRLSMTTQRNLQ
jgi:hypothetical protein